MSDPAVIQAKSLRIRWLNRRLVSHSFPGSYFWTLKTGRPSRPLAFVLSLFTSNTATTAQDYLLNESPLVTEFFATVARISVFVFLVSSMSEIGLGLRLQQIVSPLRNARLVVFALFANFIIAPLLALGIARLLRLDEPFALGLLLLGLAAGAPFMPKIAGMAKGDVALAVGLLVMLMVGTIVFLPVALPLLVTGTQVNPWKIVRLLVLLILLPLLVGLIIKVALGVVRRSPGTRARVGLRRHVAGDDYPHHLPSFAEPAARFRNRRDLCRSAVFRSVCAHRMAARRQGCGPTDGPWSGDGISQFPSGVDRQRAKLHGSQCVGDGHRDHAHRTHRPGARRAADGKVRSRYIEQARLRLEWNLVGRVCLNM